jgi:iron complex outermembrane receptor protein
MGARDLLDVLRRVPGFEVYIARFGQGEIAVRGIKSDSTEKIKVMVDGHSLNELFMGSAMTLHDHLALDNVKHIEIIRGPGSALYGANAFVAVINLVTFDGADIDGTQLTVSRGSFDTWRYNVLFGKKLDKISLAGSVAYLDTNGPRLKVEEDTFGNSGYTRLSKKKVDANLKLAYEGLIQSEDKLLFNSKVTQRERTDYLGLLGLPNDESVMDLYQYFLELSYHHAIGDKVTIGYNAYYDQFDEEIIFELLPDTLYIAPSMTSRIIGGEIEATYELFSGNLLTGGLVYEAQKQYGIKLEIGSSTNSLVEDPGNWNKDNATRDVFAAYLQDDWEIVKGLNLTLGVRYDQYSDFGGTTNPRAGLVWEFAEGISLKLLHGWAFRAPNSRELYDRNNANTAGNENLGPETIKTTEIGLDYRFSKYLEADVSYFYNRIRDIIVEGTPQGGPAPFINKGGADIQGVEIELKAMLDKDKYKYIYANYSYQDAEDSDTGENLPDVPKHKGNVGFNLGLTKYFNLNANVFMRGESPRAEGDSREEFPDYALLDTTLIIKEFFSNFELRCSIYNLLDEDYDDPSPLGWVPSDYPQPGRHYLVSVVYSF